MPLDQLHDKRAIRRWRRRRWLKRIREGVLISGTLATLALAVAVFLMRSPPSHWVEYQRFLEFHTSSQIAAMADNFEEKTHIAVTSGLDQRMAHQVDQPMLALHQPEEPTDARRSAMLEAQLIRQSVDQPYTMLLPNEDLYALVAARLDDWMEQRGYIMPGQIKTPMLAIKRGKLLIAFAVDIAGVEQVFSATTKVKLKDNGWAQLELDTLYAGRLPVPAKMIGIYLANNMPNAETAKRVGDWLQRIEDVKFKPVLELEHGRRARIIAFELQREAIQVTIQVQDRLRYKEANIELNDPVYGEQAVVQDQP